MSSMQELVGITIDHYQIQRHLTRGGMSEIYLALDTQTQATVAIKLVHTSNTDYCERFKHEAKTIAMLKHDHILPAFAYGDYNDWYYMVTPYIEYGTLNKKLADGALSFKEVERVLTQLGSALQYAHDQGIVHRDIKPTNVLLRDGEHVYLADFGLVKRVGDNNGLTVTGYLIGTPEYMAPELAEEPASAKSDQYALGVLLYQMLTGQVPFTASTPLGIYLKHIRDRPTEPSTLNPAIPESINEVILRALQKEPRHRYTTVRDFAQAYQQAFEMMEKPVHVRTLQTTAVPIDEAQTRSILPGRILQHRYKPMLITAAIAVLCIIPFIVGFIFSSYGNYGQTTQHTLQSTTGKMSGKRTHPQATPSVSLSKNSSKTSKRQSTSTPTPRVAARLALQSTSSFALSPPAQMNEEDNVGNSGNGKGNSGNSKDNNGKGNGKDNNGNGNGHGKGHGK